MDGILNELESLSPIERDRLCILARARDEPEEAVLGRFGREGLRRCPRSFSNHLRTLRTVEVSEAGLDGGLAWLRLPNGRVFYGHASHPKARREYAYVRDTFPAVIDEDIFLLAQDVAMRYATGYIWPPDEIAPPPGGSVIEAGAYLGHKTIRFVDECVGPQGRVLAIEMMPENVDVLRRNVSANRLEGVIDVLPVGVWKECGDLPVRGKGRQRNSLTEVSHISDDLGYSVPVQDLDSIIEGWGRPIIDLLYISVNGAEIEVLEGLQRCLERIRGLFIVAPYERDGYRSADLCRRILAERGCTVLSERAEDQVAAWGPAYNAV